MKIAYRSSALITLAALGFVCGRDVHAQSPRDPTQPPAAYATPVGSARVPGDAFKPEHLVTVNGVRYVVWNSRRYAVGEMIDGARIERISDSEIWLRGAGGLRKLPLFSGIEKRPPNSGKLKITSTRSSLDGKNGPTK